MKTTAEENGINSCYHHSCIAMVVKLLGNQELFFILSLVLGIR